MPTSHNIFDTPQRVERFNLLQHLISSTEQIIYVRGPAGIGKTTFTHELATVMAGRYQIVFIPSINMDVELIAANVVGCAPNDDQWTADYFDVPILIIVDQAESLSHASMDAILRLNARGCQIVFFGEGDLPQMTKIPEIQYIDIPPFDRDQTLNFLVGLGHIGLDDKVIRKVYDEAAGVPGRLLAMTKGDSETAAVSEEVASSKGSLLSKVLTIVPRWALVSVGFLLVLLLFQNDINNLFKSSVDTDVKAEQEKAGIPSHNQSKPDAIVRKPLSPMVKQRNDSEKKVAVLSVAANEEPLDLAGIVDTEAKAKADTEELEEPLMLDPVKLVPVKKEIVKSGGVKAVPVEKNNLKKDKMVATVLAKEPKKVIQQPLANVKKIEPEKEIAKIETTKKSAVLDESKKKVVKRIVHTIPKQSGHEWIAAQQPQFYTLQLVGAGDLSAIKRFLLKHNVNLPTAIFTRQLNGKPWYSLIGGSFKNREQALVAKRKLPKTLVKSDVWPRSFASIQIVKKLKK